MLHLAIDHTHPPATLQLQVPPIYARRATVPFPLRLVFCDPHSIDGSCVLTLSVCSLSLSLRSNAQLSKVRSNLTEIEPNFLQLGSLNQSTSSSPSETAKIKIKIERGRKEREKKGTNLHKSDTHTNTVAVVGCRNQGSPSPHLLRSYPFCLSSQLNNPILTQPIRYESRLVIGFLAVGDLPGCLQSHPFVGRAR